MADNRNISTNNLISYIQRHQIAYQYCDGPMEFTLSKDSEIQPRQIVNDIIGKHCRIFDAETSEEIEGYNDLFRWFQPSDLLILADSRLLICIPYNNCLTTGILKE